MNRPLAYYWGDDGFGIEEAVEALRVDPARFPGEAPSRWRIRAEPGDAGRTLAEIGARLATATMFGAGTLAILSNGGLLVRRATERESLVQLIDLIAEGNGLVVAEETDASRKEPPSKPLADAIRSAGGEVRRFEAPREGGLAAWIERRARERRIALGPGAARELATRVGGFVREGDIDRRNQGRLAVMELEKLRLLHAGDGEPGHDGRGGAPGARPSANGAPPTSPDPVTVDDVRALVPEVVPGSVWAFVDAVGMRQSKRALDLLERLFEVTPEPVLLAVLHRRLRELIEVADRIARGEQPGSLVRSMRLQPFRAETLARQAHAWTVEELATALEALLALDARVKGVGGAVSGDGQLRLAFDLWVSDAVTPRG
jgi:DNA polymerase III delta subunit